MQCNMAGRRMMTCSELNTAVMRVLLGFFSILYVCCQLQTALGPGPWSRSSAALLRPSGTLSNPSTVAECCCGIAFALNFGLQFALSVRIRIARRALRLLMALALTLYCHHVCFVIHVEFLLCLHFENAAGRVCAGHRLPWQRAGAACTCLEGFFDLNLTLLHVCEPVLLLHIPFLMLFHTACAAAASLLLRPSWQMLLCSHLEGNLLQLIRA